MDSDRLDQLIDRAAIDDLVRAVDDLAAAPDWDRLVLLRDRCR